LIHEHQVCVVMALGQALRKLDHADSRREISS
jgi:hypothetical protein